LLADGVGRNAVGSWSQFAADVRLVVTDSTRNEITMVSFWFVLLHYLFTELNTNLRLEVFALRSIELAVAQPPNTGAPRKVTTSTSFRNSRVGGSVVAEI
jgi:hypothetical protein